MPDYCVLPDGSIHWLNKPEDYIEARQIISDEVQSIIEAVNGSLDHAE